MGLRVVKDFGEQGLFSGGGRKCQDGNVDVVALVGYRLGKVTDGVAVAGGVVLFVEA